MVFWSQYKVFSYLIDMVKGSLSVLQDHFLKPLWSFEMWSGVGKVLDNWRYLNCLPQPFSTQVSTTVVPLPELRLWLQLVSSSEDVTHYLKKTLLLSLPVCWGSWRFFLLHSSLYLKVGEETERTRLWMKFWMFRKPPDFWLPWRQDFTSDKLGKTQILSWKIVALYETSIIYMSSFISDFEVLF